MDKNLHIRQSHVTDDETAAWIFFRVAGLLQKSFCDQSIVYTQELPKRPAG